VNVNEPLRKPEFLGSENEAALRSATILVVEDEAIVAMDLVQQLQEMGYSVCDTADNGKDALALAKKHKPDLVMMDIVIKGDVDGIEIAAEIGPQLHVPVVFLTAYSDNRTVERAVRVAPYGYLTKPFQPREMRAGIEVALYKARLERRLRESEQWFASMLRCVGDGVIATDHNGQLRFMNPSAEALTGWRHDEALGRNVNEILRLENAETRTPVESPVQRAIGDNAVVGIDYAAWLAARDGTLRPVDHSAAPIRDDDGNVLGAVVVFRDVAERLRAEDALRSSEKEFRNAFDFAPAGMALVAMNGEFLQVNTALCAMLCGDSSLDAASHWEFTHPGDVQMEHEQLLRLLSGETPSVRFEKRYRRKDGREVWALANVSLLYAANAPRCYLYQVYDLTERKEAERQLAHLAHYDPLTGLANRAFLREEAERMIAIARRERKKLAVVMLDLDNFKYVNDSLGHDAGDQLLKTVSKRLQATLRDTDCIARLGGDEFVMLLSGFSRAEEAMVVSEKVRVALSQPITLGRQETQVTPSMGISICPDDGTEWRELLRCADSALYHAKAEGRNNAQFYRLELTAKMEWRMRLQSALRHALARREFVLHYQPIVSFASGRPNRAEALVRWHHPERGLLGPDEFIAAAEETGLIVELGEWVLFEACREAVRWKNMGVPLTVSVNVSARQFKAGSLADVVRRALEASGLDPSLLCLEITEQLVLKDSEQNLALLADIKALGVGITIDDFGVGYSSLSYIKRFAPGSLKIDRSFMLGLVESNDAAAIVKAVIAMARHLDIEVIAEGVENEAQHVFLEAQGCHETQGYLYAKPRPAEEFRDWLTATR
jgi:diguanylate cyclase (GGDEF)-like protein/PAS domain S-box-containing protein